MVLIGSAVIPYFIAHWLGQIWLLALVYATLAVVSPSRQWIGWRQATAKRSRLS